MVNTFPANWTGSYAYDHIEGYDVQPSSATFTLRFEFGWFRRFTGTVNDGPESNMQETGTISGRLKNNEIQFTKHMPVETLLTPGGVHHRTDRQHPPIHYVGTFDAATGTLAGTWHFVPFQNPDNPDEYFGGAGIWSARPIADESVR